LAAVAPARSHKTSSGSWTGPSHPVGRHLTEIRRIRDELDLLVIELLAGLPTEPHGGR
jgi:hypothetical protein